MHPSCAHDYSIVLAGGVFGWRAQGHFMPALMNQLEPFYWPPVHHHHLMMCSVSQFPITFSPKLEAISSGLGSRAPKPCHVQGPRGLSGLDNVCMSLSCITPCERFQCRQAMTKRVHK